ncbi:MAG: hypothetical protein CEE43_17415 [Promethearchaeota archaeon Loki_b32]|nr:MAG: hypothetical protein CEE43_17415 [Candidatus Lokiarchaeota archaeon Loki_b32]
MYVLNEGENLKNTVSVIILALRKESDLGNLLSFLKIPNSFQDKFMLDIENIQSLINKNVIDSSILELENYYDIFFAKENLELYELSKKHIDLFRNSITPEMLVGADLLLLLGASEEKLDYLVQNPKYRVKTGRFIRSILVYLKDIKVN